MSTGAATPDFARMLRAGNAAALEHWFGELRQPVSRYFLSLGQAFRRTGPGNRRVYCGSRLGHPTRTRAHAWSLIDAVLTLRTELFLQHLFDLTREFRFGFFKQLAAPRGRETGMDVAHAAIPA